MNEMNIAINTRIEFNIATQNIWNFDKLRCKSFASLSYAYNNNNIENYFQVFSYYIFC